MKKVSVISKFFGIAVLTLLFSACKTPENITYIQDLNEDVVIDNVKKTALRVQPNDKLSIIVHSKDPELAALFNLPIVSNNLNNMGTAPSGTGTLQKAYQTSGGISSYTVSPEGTIEFPVLGTLNIKGMTRNEVAAFIKGELIGRHLVKDPTVTVEFLNSGVSILGEVKTPGRFDMNRDNITILEAIALAGDLTIQGRRENVKVIRETPEGKVQVYQIDLTAGNKMMESPGYYLRQNDVVYVEPTDHKKRETTANGNTTLSASFWVSASSLVMSLAVLVVNIIK